MPSAHRWQNYCFKVILVLYALIALTCWLLPACLSLLQWHIAAVWRGETSTQKRNAPTFYLDLIPTSCSCKSSTSSSTLNFGRQEEEVSLMVDCGFIQEHSSSLGKRTGGGTTAFKHDETGRDAGGSAPVQHAVYIMDSVIAAFTIHFSPYKPTRCATAGPGAAIHTSTETHKTTRTAACPTAPSGKRQPKNEEQGASRDGKPATDTPRAETCR